MKLSDHQKEQNRIISWANNLLREKDKYLIFETETTGIKSTDVVIHIALMDLDGNLLMNQPVNPKSKRSMSSDAEELHGYSLEDLKAYPSFKEIYPEFIQLVDGKILLSYNGHFHFKMLEQTFSRELKGIDPPKLKGMDVRMKYRSFSARWAQGLPGRENTGEGDCRAVLNVINEMAGAPIHRVPQWQVVDVFWFLLIIILAPIFIISIPLALYWYFKIFTKRN